MAVWLLELGRVPGYPGTGRVQATTRVANHYPLPDVIFTWVINPHECVNRHSLTSESNVSKSQTSNQLSPQTISQHVYKYVTRILYTLQLEGCSSAIETINIFLFRSSQLVVSAWKHYSQICVKQALVVTLSIATSWIFNIEY